MVDREVVWQATRCKNEKKKKIDITLVVPRKTLAASGGWGLFTKCPKNMTMHAAVMLMDKCFRYAAGLGNQHAFTYCCIALQKASAHQELSSKMASGIVRISLPAESPSITHMPGPND